MTDWEGMREQITRDRGVYCFICDIAPFTELHHCLVHRKAGHSELDTIENLCPVCSNCHPHANGYATRCRFWRYQCSIYGHERMVEWLENLGLKAPPKFE